MADITDMVSSNRSMPVMGGSNSLNLSASQQLKAGAGLLCGVFVAAASNTPTIKFWDSLAASGTVLIGTFTPSVGWNPMPFAFRTGLYMTIGGTVDCSVSWS